MKLECIYSRDVVGGILFPFQLMLFVGVLKYLTSEGSGVTPTLP